MSHPVDKDDSAPPRRRYVVHLCVIDPEPGNGRYLARIRPWAARSIDARTCERAFADDCELIATINPFLSPGSDVRDVFGHIESPTGFYYLLHLTIEEAIRLGWNA